METRTETVITIKLSVEEVESLQFVTRMAVELHRHGKFELAQEDLDFCRELILKLD